MSRRYDYVAAKTGVVLVPSCGFDSVPADLTVLLSNKTLKAAAGPRASLGNSLTVYRANGGFSGGTFASLLAIAENVPFEKIREASADYSLCPGELLHLPHPHMRTKAKDASLSAGEVWPEESALVQDPIFGADTLCDVLVHRREQSRNRAALLGIECCRGLCEGTGKGGGGSAISVRTGVHI